MWKRVMSFVQEVLGNWGGRGAAQARSPVLLAIPGLSEGAADHLRSASALNRALALRALKNRDPDAAFNYVVSQLRESDHLPVHPEMDRQYFHLQYRAARGEADFPTRLWRIYTLLEESLSSPQTFLRGEFGSVEIVVCNGQIVRSIKREIPYAA